MRYPKRLILSALFSAAFLAACGGGSTDTVSNVPMGIVGTAATGAAMAGGTVQIYGADGVALLTPAATIANDGSYSASIPGNAKFPLVFVADDGSQKLISVMASATQSTIVNVTQLTNLIAARISPTGDPGNLLSEVVAGTVMSAASVLDKTNEVLLAIRPLLEAHGLTPSNSPITTPFAANGVGYDKMLDTLDVKIEPKGSTSTIEITVKQAVAEDAQLPKVSLTSDQSIPQLATISAAGLPEDGLSAGLGELLAQATACYALPRSERVVTGGTAAADITASACKAMFIGSLPENYRSGGHIVGSRDHFAGIFTANVPVVFSSPRYYYSIAQDVSGGPRAGDVAFGYRWKDEYGNYQYERNIVRKDTDGKYRFVGNRYQYPGGTTAYSQRRNFLMQQDSSFNSVGYAFDVPCNTYTKSWKKVNITAPNGGKLTLVPSLTGSACNYSYFVIASDTTTDVAHDPSARTGSGFIRIRSEYEDASKVLNADHPRTRDSSLVFLHTDFTEAQIEAIPQFGVWKYEYFTTDFTTPVATQYFKTISRAMTIAGFRNTVKLPTLETSYLANLISRISCVGLSCGMAPSAGPFGISWTANEAAKTMPEPPATYRARIYGKYGPSGSRVGFEDSVDVRSSARSASISCGNGDGGSSPQCVGGVTGADYSSTTSIGNIDLISRLPDGSESSHFQAMYKLY